MSHRIRNRTFKTKLVTLIVSAILVILLGACRNLQPVDQTPQPPTPTPPPADIPGRWTTFIAENQTAELDDFAIKVKQLRFGTTGRMFPDATSSELNRQGLEGATVVIGVLVEAKNNSDRTNEFSPGGNRASLLVNNSEESEPLTSVGDVRRRISSGETTDFLVVFPVFETTLDKIESVTYRLEDLEFDYTDLRNLAGPPE